MLACLGLLYSTIFLGDGGLKGFKGLNDDKVLGAGMSLRLWDFLTNMRGRWIWMGKKKGLADGKVWSFILLFWIFLHFLVLQSYFEPFVTKFLVV
jgi:hypothetical protein